MRYIWRFFRAMESAAVLMCAGALFAFSGCTPIGPSAKEELWRPVNCHNANINVFVLNSQRVGAVEQAASAISVVLPPVILADLVRGEYGDRLLVASGQYNQMIEVKAAQYAKNCGVRR